MTTNVDVTDIIEGTHLGRYQFLILAICGVMVLFDGFDQTAISFAVPQFIKLFGIDKAMTGSVFSAGLFGLTVGALTLGLIGDRWGPSRTFLLCCLGFGVFELATSTATSLPQLAVYRFFAGLALGGASPISIAIASNYCPKKIRTTVVMIMYINVAIGQTLAGYAYGFLNAFGWKTIFYIGGTLPIVFAALFLFVLPEPVEHLVMKGVKREKIVKILSHVVPSRVFDTLSTFVVPPQNKKGFTLYLLFKDGRALSTSILWIVFFTSIMALYFYNSWLPTLFTGLGLSMKEIVAITTSLPIGGIAGTLFFAPLVLKLGAFRTVSLGYCCAAIAMIVLSVAGTGFVALFLSVLGVGFFLIGTQSALNASSAEIYPSSLRSTGVSWGFGIGRIGSILSPAVAGILLAFNWSPAQLFQIAAIPALAASAFAFVL